MSSSASAKGSTKFDLSVSDHVIPEHGSINGEGRQDNARDLFCDRFVVFLSHDNVTRADGKGLSVGRMTHR